jgi:dihydroneopterin aldolase
MSSSVVLSVEDYSVLCSLGCTAEERATLQEVRASVRIRFAQAPKACETDQLQDTLCYAEVCARIKQVVESKGYQTVEHLARAIVLRLETLISKDDVWSLKIHKVNPPIQGLRGGVTFELGHGL